jgi:hypothetical protein
MSRFEQQAPTSPPISICLDQVFVKVVFQGHPKSAKDLLQMGVQGVQLFQNVILTLFQLVQKLTWFDIRDL